MKTPVSRARDMFRSLRLTLVLSMVVPLMVFSGVAIYVGLGAVERNLNDRLREDLELVARAVSGPLSKPVLVSLLAVLVAPRKDSGRPCGLPSPWPEAGARPARPAR